MPSLRLTTVFLALLLTRPAAALEWQAETLTVTTVPFQKTADVTFTFRNHGPKPVALLDLQTNCDCLDAIADQKFYAPGATGSVKATFTLGDRPGLYERLITVVTDEAPAPVRLVVRIEVPDIATVSPRSVSWKLNEPAEERTIEVAPAPGLEIEFTGAVPTTDAFTARLETVAAGRLYRLHLRPRSTAAPASVAVRILGKERTGHDIVASAYAYVQ